MKKNRGMIVAFLTPAVAFFCLIFLYPIVRTVGMSLFNINGLIDPISEWNFVGVQNYITLVNTELFRNSMWNLLRIWIIGGIAVMIISLLLAVILTSGIRFTKFARAVIYLPNIVSAVALATMWLQAVYSPKFGILKNFFTKIGAENLANIQWLSGDNKFYALLIAYCFGIVGYHMLIFISGIERISPEYYESATIDGANKIQQFRYITFPLLKGVLRTNLIMWSISSMSFFVWSQLFSSLGMDTSTVTPMVYMYVQLFGSGAQGITERNSGLGAAIGVVLCTMTIIIFWILNRSLKDQDVEF